MAAEIILLKGFAAVFVVIPTLILFHVLTKHKRKSVAFVNKHMEKTNDALVPLMLSFLLLLLANVFELADYLGAANRFFIATEVLSILFLGLSEWYFVYILAVKKR